VKGRQSGYATAGRGAYIFGYFCKTWSAGLGYRETLAGIHGAREVGLSRGSLDLGVLEWGVAYNGSDWGLIIELYES
jgi:hypothetical protein